jgi:hypothetical protein
VPGWKHLRQQRVERAVDIFLPVVDTPPCLFAFDFELSSRLSLEGRRFKLLCGASVPRCSDFLPTVRLPPITSFQQRSLTGHAELAHNAVGLMLILQPRTSTKHDKCSSESSQRSQQRFFISIVVVVHAVALAIVIVDIAGWG